MDEFNSVLNYLKIIYDPQSDNPNRLEAHRVQKIEIFRYILINVSYLEDDLFLFLGFRDIGRKVFTNAAY